MRVLSTGLKTDNSLGTHALFISKTIIVSDVFMKRTFG